MFQKLLLVSLLIAAGSAAPTDTHSIDFLLANITSLWEEIGELRKEVNYHVHHGKIDADYNFDETLDETERLAHEHHVHHLKHPHEGHADHHDSEMLQHLETEHGHGDHGDHGHHDDHGDHGHHGDHGAHGHDDDDHSAEGYDSEEDSASSGRGHGRGDGVVDNCGDPGRRGGAVQANCGGRRGGVHRGHGHEHLAHGHGGHGHGGRDHGGHGHRGHGGHGSSHEEGGDHAHEGSHEDIHDMHGLDLKALGHVNSDAKYYEADHYEHGQDGHDHGVGHGRDHQPGVYRDQWVHASCDLLPNSEMPDSHVKGRIDISERIDAKTGIFFDADVSGFDASQAGGTFGFHIHEHAIEGQNCETAGDLLGSSGGSYPGFIGDYVVDGEGEIDHEIMNREDIELSNTVGKAIVIHDVGTSSRLACCNVVLSPIMVGSAGSAPDHHHH